MFSNYLQHEIETAIKREISRESKDSWESHDDKSWNSPSMEELVQCFQNISSDPKLRKRSFGLFCIRIHRSRTEQSLAQELVQIVANSPKRGDSLTFTQEGSFLRVGMVSSSKTKVQFSTHQEWLEANSSNSSAVSHFIPNKFASEGRIYTVLTSDLRKIAQEGAWDKLADPLVCQTWIKAAIGSPSRTSILVKSEFSKFGQQRAVGGTSAQYSPSLTSSKSGVGSYDPFKNLVSGDNKFENENLSGTNQGQNCDLRSSPSKKKQISFALEPENCSHLSANGSCGSVSSELSPDRSRSDDFPVSLHSLEKQRNMHRATRAVKTIVENIPMSREEVQLTQASEPGAGHKHSKSSLEELRANSCSEGQQSHDEELLEFGGVTKYDKNSTNEPSTHPGSPAFTSTELQIGELAPKMKLRKYALNPRVAWAGKS